MVMGMKNFPLCGNDPSAAAVAAGGCGILHGCKLLHQEVGMATSLRVSTQAGEDRPYITAHSQIYHNGAAAAVY